MKTHEEHSASEIRHQMSGDAHRPGYHFLPPSNWMNDPNGLIQWNGEYHLFYQYNPVGSVHRHIHWGHAVSKDLVHWMDLPIALAPTPGGPDETGVFSGCAVNNGGVPTLIYTGVTGNDYAKQVQCSATSQDGLLTWEKQAANPLISEVPEIARQTQDFRDPYVWQQDDIWYMVLGSRVQDVGGIVFLYRSHDLIDWEYLNPLYVGGVTRREGTWECPNFFKLDDSWVLIVSPHSLDRTMGRTTYFVGDFVDHKFIPRHEGAFDHGCLYAPLTFQDDRGRHIMMAWLREERSSELQQIAGWSGVQSFPRVLTLKNDRLHMTPIPEIEQLRGNHQHFSLINLANPTHLGTFAQRLEMEIESTSNRLILTLANTANGNERTEITYDRNAQQLEINRAHASTTDSVDRSPYTAEHALGPDEPLKLRVLLDGSVLEIIANERTSVCTRIYPTQSDTVALEVHGTGTVNTLNVWEMAAIWP